MKLNNSGEMAQTSFGGQFNLEESVEPLEYYDIEIDPIEELKNDILEIVGDKWGKKGARFSIDYQPGTRPVTFRNPELVELGKEVVEEIVDNYKLNEEPLLGGEDFSYYLEPLNKKTIDGLMIMVGAANSKKDIPPSVHHTPKFKIDEDVIPEMSAVYAELARRYLEQQNKKPNN